jgi:hypothetical protein
MCEFTAGQIARVRSTTAIYRSHLLGALTAKAAFRTGIDLFTGNF